MYTKGEFTLKVVDETVSLVFEGSGNAESMVQAITFMAVLTSLMSLARRSSV